MLISKTLEFYAEKLFNAHWGEQIAFGKDNTVQIAMVFQGMEQDEAEKTWAPFIDELRSAEGISVDAPLTIFGIPAQHFWDANYLRKCRRRGRMHVRSAPHTTHS